MVVKNSSAPAGEGIKVITMKNSHPPPAAGIRPPGIRREGMVAAGFTSRDRRFTIVIRQKRHFTETRDRVARDGERDLSAAQAGKNYDGVMLR